MKVASIVLCAGVGSRMKSSKAKILHQLAGKPMAYWPIKNALESGSHKPVIVVNHQRELVEAELKRHFHDQISFVLQEVPEGTGSAVKAAIGKLDPDCESVLIVYGDTPLLQKASLDKLITIQQRSHVPIALLSTRAVNPTGYGRIVRNDAQQIVAIVEELEANQLEKEISEINPGVYVFDADFLRENIYKIDNNNAKKEYYLTDLIKIYLKSGAKLGPVQSIEVSYEEIHGVNDRCQLAFAEQVLNRRMLERWMLDGVSIIDPSSTYIEESVLLAKDVVIYPGVHLRGHTCVGEACVIENGCVINDTIIEKNAHIYPYSCTDQAYIGERSQVGPFARLRPEARLDQDVKVGNFIEIKRSRLKKGTKAGHVAYIGDADIGEDCNIGAGSISCNYDGKNKFRTIIGDRVFVGSNTTLVAPLSIGNDSYIAGGSTINKEVPKETLAIGRAQQVNKARHWQDRS